ncbi:hypothetical protein OH77DRAFT_1521271 [Trametes cingulata]|nr:hypothetical protein OH77DRAFT_1521271 [Trametes cingulata]
MSSAQAPGSGASQLISLFSSFYASQYCGLATSVLLIHEYIITFDKEVNLFWSRKPTGASFVFFANRYLFLAQALLEVGGFAKISDETHHSQTCRRYVPATRILEYMQYLPWAGKTNSRTMIESTSKFSTTAFSALRAFAISSASGALTLNKLRWPLGVFVLLLSLVPLGINYYQFSQSSAVNDPTFGCGVAINISESLTNHCLIQIGGHSKMCAVKPAKKDAADPTSVIIASRACLIGADVAVLLVTWSTTYSASKAHRAMQLSGTALASTLLRDGTIYFFILLVLNTLRLTFSLLSIGQAPVDVSYVIIFTEPLTAILVSRMLLNLQEVDTGINGARRATLTSIAFVSRVVGSMGSGMGPLEVEEEPDLEENPTSHPRHDDTGVGGQEAGSVAA